MELDFHFDQVEDMGEDRGDGGSDEAVAGVG